MKKQEFIDKLRMALNGRISPEQVAENINYYEDYINTQMRMGKSEAEVLQSLGDPRLIAKTIIDAGEKADNQSTDYQESAYRNSAFQYDSQPQQERRTRVFHIPKWLWLTLITIVILVVISLVFSILSVFAPLIFTIFVVVFLVKLFRDWLN